MEVRRVGGQWEAVEGHETVGAAEVWDRPDGRRFLHVAADATPDARHMLLRTVAADVDAELHTWVSSSASRLRATIEEQGFATYRFEDTLTIDPVVADRWLRANPGPDLELVGVHELGLDQLQALDEELRDDVPGCDGWRWDPQAFRAETLSSGHDDELYRIAIEGREPVGLVRVWLDHGAPRIGLVGVRRPHRGRGVARHLLGAVFAVLVERDAPEVVTEADPDNTPIRRLLAAIGGEVTATMVEYVRPADQDG